MKRKKVSTHTPGLPMRLFVLAVGLIAAGIHAFAFRMLSGVEETAIPFFFMMIALFFDALILWWGVIFMTQSRVTLYEEGIELERGSTKVFTTWDNVSHLGIKGGGRNQKRGLYLYKKVKPESKGLIDRLMFGWESKFLPIGRYVHLPCEWNLFSRKIDTDKFLKTAFGQELYDVAPHLFEEYDEWKPKNRLDNAYMEDEGQLDWLQELDSKQKKSR